MVRNLVIIGGTFLVMVLINFFSIFLAQLLLNQPLRFKQRIISFIGISLIFSFFISAVSLVDISQLGGQLSVITYSLVMLLQFTSGYLLIKLFFQVNHFYITLFIQSIAASLIIFFEYIFLGLFSTTMAQLPELLSLFSAVLVTVGQVVSASLLCLLLRRSQIMSAIRNLMDYPRFMLIFSSLFFVSDLIIYPIYFYHNPARTNNAWLLSVVYLIILVIFALWAFAIDQKRQWEYSQQLMLQQQNYLQQMEAVQKELRSIQHDYKNMLAGIYLHASEGNLTAVQQFLSDKFFQIDHRITEKLQQQNSLALIKPIELKSLLITKLMTAETKGIPLNLEVHGEVDTLPMKTADLLRILGIFIDNSLAEEKTLSILFISESETLTIVVKNPFSQKITLKELTQTGFTTKGKNHGLGLANVRSILANYPDVLHETSLKNQEFRQTLTIRK